MSNGNKTAASHTEKAKYIKHMINAFSSLFTVLWFYAV